MNTSNDQYIPPTFYTTESTLKPTSPEFEKNHEWGDFIRDIQRSIESFRLQSDETTIDEYEARSEKRGRLRSLASSATKPFKVSLSRDAIENQLINKEAVAMGKTMPAGPGVTSQLFWYFKDDWFYQVTEASKTKAPTASAARYQVVGNELYKTVNTAPVPLGEGEKEAFTIWSQQYHSVLAKGLYLGKDDVLIDAELDFLMDSDDVKAALSKDDYRLAA